MSGQLSYELLRELQARPCSLRYLASDRDSEPELDAALAEVGERRTQRGFESFSLRFHATDSGVPRQGIYAVAFAGMPRQEWFLVPVARDGGRIVYEACFNRAIEAGV